MVMSATHLLIDISSHHTEAILHFRAPIREYRKEIFFLLDFFPLAASFRLISNTGHRNLLPNIRCAAATK